MIANPLAVAIELETRLLSAASLHPEYVTEIVSAGVIADAFLDHDNRDIFQALCASASEGSCDHETIFSHLPVARRSYETLTRLDAISDMEPTGARLKNLTAEVMGAWRKRRLERASAMILEKAKSNSQWDEVWSESAELMRKMGDIASDTKVETIATVAARAKEAFKKRCEHSADYGISLGFDSLDRAFTRIKPDEFVILAGRPSSGKSSLAGQIVSKLVRQQKRVAVFNLETSSNQFIERQVAHETGIAFADVWGDRMNRFIAHFDEIGKRRSLHVFDQLQDIDTIEARARTLSSASPLDLVVIDYLQLVRSSNADKRENREQQVSGVSRRLKLLVNSLKCPVLALAQFNRESVKDGVRPQMHHLRDSGALEQDADRILILHVEPPEDGSPDDRVNAETALIQDKGKDAPRGACFKLMFNRPTYTFAPLARE